MSTTPRTDAALKVTIGAGFEAVSPNFARTLETELAAACSERDIAISRVASILWSGKLDKHTCGEVQQWAKDYTDELTTMTFRAMKAEAALAKANATIEDFFTGGCLTCDQCLEAMPCNCGNDLSRP